MGNLVTDIFQQKSLSGSQLNEREKQMAQKSNSRKFFPRCLRENISYVGYRLRRTSANMRTIHRQYIYVMNNVKKMRSHNRTVLNPTASEREK